MVHAAARGWLRIGKEPDLARKDHCAVFVAAHARPCAQVAAHVAVGACAGHNHKDGRGRRGQQRNCGCVGGQRRVCWRACGKGRGRGRRVDHNQPANGHVALHILCARADPAAEGAALHAHVNPARVGAAPQKFQHSIERQPGERRLIDCARPTAQAQRRDEYATGWDGCGRRCRCGPGCSRGQRYGCGRRGRRLKRGLRRCNGLRGGYWDCLHQKRVGAPIAASFAAYRHLQVDGPGGSEDRSSPLLGVILFRCISAGQQAASRRA